MGDNSQSCRGFETPTLTGDLWPMGFDVDLALDGPGGRKGPGGTLGSAGLGGGGLNSLQTTPSVGGGYNDIQHLSGLSSILQRFDDLHAGDICQMTDLTNSLPKGDSETAQSLLAKLACQDLGPDLSSGTDPSHKDLETSLFDQTPTSMTEASGNGNQAVADVYGRMTCFGGKIILQLRHVNLSTSYTLNVGECWLCGEKVNSRSQLFTHKHSLNGMFQVNDEYVQLDIEHYIIPEQALDPSVGQDMTSGVMQHSDTSGLHPGLNTRGLELPGNLTGGGDGLTLGEGSPTLQYSEPGLVPPLSSSSNLMNSAVPVNHNSCMSSFNQLPLPGMPITGNQTNINTSMSTIGNPDTISHATQPLCSVSTPVFGLSHSDPSCSNTMVVSTPCERKTSMSNSQMNDTNNYSLGAGLNSFSGNAHVTANGSVQGQMCHRDTGNRKHPFQYQTAFSNTDFSYHGTTMTTDTIAQDKQAEAPTLTQLHSVSNNLDVREQRPEVVPKKAETGAKKRKSRAQRKPSVIQMREYRTDVNVDFQSKNFGAESVECLPMKSYNPQNLGIVQVHVKNEGVGSEHLIRSEASIEDWIKHNLPEGDLVVLDNKAKGSLGQQKTSSLDVTSDNQKSPSELCKIPSKLHADQKSREPDQTSRLAAHMLTKGLDVTCRVCSKEFGKDVKNYKAHMKEHGIEDEALFSCCFCTKTFTKGKHYTQHLKTHIRTRRFSCRLCNASYSREAKLRRHMLNHSQEHQEKDFNCTKCQKSFGRKEYLQNHMKKFHDGKKYKCEICGFLCSSPFNLETHRMKHMDDKPYKCELCEKTFVRRDFLDNHMELVHKNKRSKCEVCGKLFSRKDVLKRHLAVHNNQTYDCEICGKKFTRKDRLATHRKIHKLHRNFKCSMCPASFARSCVLSKHEKIHKIKEQCKVCCKFLPSKLKLEAHMALHEKHNTDNNSSNGDTGGMVKCEICDKTLSSKDILMKHLRKIHNKYPPNVKKVEVVEREKKFVCHWCSKGFTRSCNLNAHLLRAHNNKDPEDDEEFDDLPSMVQTKKTGSRDKTKKVSRGSPISSAVISNALTTSPYHGFTDSISVQNCNTSPLESLSGGLQSIGTSTGVLPFPTNLPTTSSLAASHPPPPLTLPSSSHFPSSAPPDSPINLSTEGITAAAYLLAYPSYAGPY
ncbi:hypothetical protein Pcinc_035244 [Petrolisthes cinctipes]|uniref:C2H2-type domain-containing protein n=1 Tax=Petrolisthes cinctipes TaxID=88211 RepID=A0AAE1BYP3_PETCI|nr:hypothetical protein Pcinc_035244 [Petrolisthes cinctipes]